MILISILLLFILLKFVNCIDTELYPTVHKVSRGNPQWTSALVAPSNWKQSQYEKCPQELTWGISYDDGPSPRTQLALDALDKYGLKSTFFVIGSNVLENPEMLLKTYQKGHQIGIHTWSHPDLTTLSNDQIVAELVWTMKIVKDVIGVTPIYFRPPYGETNDRVLGIAASLGLKTIIWNRDSKDWFFTEYFPGKKMEPPFKPNDGPSAVIDRFKRWASGEIGYKGSISLQHDFFKETAPLIDGTLQALSQSPYNVTDIQGCLGFPAYDESIWKILPMTGDRPTASHDLSPKDLISSETTTVDSSFSPNATPSSSNSEPVDDKNQTKQSEKTADMTNGGHSYCIGAALVLLGSSMIL